MVLEARPQTRMIRVFQGQMIIHHWKPPSNVKNESLLIAFYHALTRVQPSERLLILNWRQGGERKRYSNYFFTYSFITLCNSLSIF